MHTQYERTQRMSQHPQLRPHSASRRDRSDRHRKQTAPQNVPACTRCREWTWPSGSHPAAKCCQSWWSWSHCVPAWSWTWRRCRHPWLTGTRKGATSGLRRGKERRRSGLWTRGGAGGYNTFLHGRGCTRGRQRRLHGMTADRQRGCTLGGLVGCSVERGTPPGRVDGALWCKTQSVSTFLVLTAGHTLSRDSPKIFSHVEQGGLANSVFCLQLLLWVSPQSDKAFESEYGTHDDVKQLDRQKAASQRA